MWHLFLKRAASNEQEQAPARRGLFFFFQRASCGAAHDISSPDCHFQPVSFISFALMPSDFGLQAHAASQNARSNWNGTEVFLTKWALCLMGKVIWPPAPAKLAWVPAMPWAWGISTFFSEYEQYFLSSKSEIGQKKNCFFFI